MNCVHQSEDDSIKRVPKEMFKKKQDLEKSNSFLEPNSNRNRSRNTEEEHKTFCCECDNSCTSSWMCLTCGFIFCGRNDMGHGLSHYSNKQHPVMMNCINFELFCYSCDDEVTLDFEPSLYQVIKSLRLLFDREEFDDESPTSKPIVIEEMTSAFQAASLDTKKKKSKKGKKGKVCPVQDIPTQTKFFDSTPPAAVMETVRPRGLKNIGNTCFMNSGLQALASVQPMKDYIMSLPSLEDFISEDEAKTDSKKIITPGFLTDELKKLFISMSARNYRDAGVPSEFREVFITKCPKFKGFRQHDAHEFILFLIDNMHDEQKRCQFLPEMPDSTTPMSHFFEGMLQSRLICLNCKTRSNKDDVFKDLSLEIPRQYKQRLRLSDSLETFFAKEVLERNEKADCSKCKSKQDCTKQMFIKKLPQCLVLHIKRFQFTGSKVDTLIEFPTTNLSLDDFLTEDNSETPCTYELTSFIVHIGYGCGSGHYIAFGKRDGIWYQFDDQIVKTVPESLVSKQKAYVLFYTKRDVRPDLTAHF